MGYLINNLSTLSTLTNITLDNVYTNAKALFHFINVDATFNILNVNNIKCAGDADDSSLILFEAAEKHHELRINYLTAKNSLSNGSFIKLLGSSVRLAFRYFTIDNLTIYGSVIESKSLSTEIILKYSTFSNSMNVKKNGCGIVHLNNNLNITISNNEFINNHNKCNGGVICFDNISSMTIRLSSNNFEENSAISGGALYFADSTLTTPMTIKEEDQESSIRSNTFINNQVETFGGAIYSSYNKMYLVSVKNNTITGNKANIAGAGIFAPKMVNQTMLSLKGNTLDKNVVGTNLNMYSSNPSHIKLNSTMTSSSIRSGDLFPLAFTLHDHFDNILEDFSNFYSSITLKLFLLQRKERKEEGEEEEEYGDEDEEEVDHFKNKNFYLKGNIGQFINGRCELNNFYIYANTGTYQLKAMIENYNEEITMDFNIIIHVNGCDANQVKLFKNEILYCENPICRANCPDKISATCISPNEFINDIRQNNCHCNEGYTGNDCNEKIFINFSTFNRILLIITIIMTIIIASFILFVLIYRRQSIISDIGIFKILFFSIGILLFYISILFSTYTDYKGCSLYVFFKHTGIAMVLGTFYILTIINYKLGHSLKFKKISQSQDIDEESIEENDLPLFDNSKALVLDTSDNGHIKKINFNNASSLSITSTSVREGLKKVIDVEKKKEEEGFGEYNENIIKKIKKVKSLYLEVILAFPLYLISILLIIVIQLRQEERDTADAPQSYIVQNKDAKWTYQCNLIKTDNVYSTIEFMVFAAILWRGNTMTKFENIFKYISYITYCAWVGIFFGPLVNFLGQIILSNQRYGKVIFTTLLNSVCYLAIFIIFVWEIVVLILTNKGNERGTYFIYKRHDYCAIHESTVCGCKLKMDKTELSVYIKRSIDFYAICSLLYEIVDGKLIYVNNKSKIKILNHV